MASIAEAVVITDAIGRVLFLNRAAGELIGRNRADVVGTAFESEFRFIDARTREPVVDVIEAVRRGGARDDAACDLELLDGGGRAVPISLSAMPLRRADGSTYGVALSIMGCTARRHAQQQLRQANEALRAEKEWLARTLDGIAEEVYFTDMQGRYTYANPAVFREFGHSLLAGIEVKQIIANMVVLRADGTPRPIDEAPPLRALTGEVVRNEEQIVRIPRTGELRHRIVSSAPVRDSAGIIVGSVSIARDISERKRAELALREADHRKNLFLATLSRQVRSAFTPIADAARLLESGQATPMSGERFEAIVSNGGAYIFPLLDGLDDIVELMQGRLSLRKQPVTLRRLLEEAVQVTRPFMEARRHQLRVDLPSDRLKVNADADRLRQVVSNLLMNAAQYTRLGGQITLGCRLEAQSLALFVRDTGIGLGQEVLASIFDMFVQLELPGGMTREGGLGVGIGLTLAKALAELHGGSIVARSAGRDQGSTFTVTLPRTIVVVEDSGAA